MRGIIHVKSLHLTGCCRRDNIGPVNWHRRENVPSCLLQHIKAIKLFVWERKGVEFQMVVQLFEYILKKAKVLECLTMDTRVTKKEERIMGKTICALPRVSKNAK
ncbi:hypothetical protein Golax_001093 [Gossypium laxum]|uniref:FBD domain-containing protein n=1 Tax=Gossypium laxum TaxID=34288 RepID=A0A7J9AVZ5_9ROSI|nr:hypothetical protein [Gossypium laxum]